jgi:hypothetical protein
MAETLEFTMAIPEGISEPLVIQTGIQGKIAVDNQAI